MSIPVVRIGAELEMLDGQVVKAVGTYLVTSMLPHLAIYKRPDGSLAESETIVYLRLKDKTVLDLGVRPDEEISRFDAKDVAVTGRLRAKLPPIPQDRAAPDPLPLIFVESVEALISE